MTQNSFKCALEVNKILDKHIFSIYLASLTRYIVLEVWQSSWQTNFIRTDDL